MTKVIAGITASADGYITGLDEGPGRLGAASDEDELARFFGERLARETAKE